RDEHLCAAPMRVGDAVAHLAAVEVQAGEIARIGLVAEAAIDRVRAGIDRGAQPGRRAGRTDELEWRLGHGTDPIVPARVGGGASSRRRSPSRIASAPRLTGAVSGAGTPAGVAGAISASRSALRSASTADVSPSMTRSREKNSASPS